MYNHLKRYFMYYLVEPETVEGKDVGLLEYMPDGRAILSDHHVKMLGTLEGATVVLTARDLMAMKEGLEKKTACFGKEPESDPGYGSQGELSPDGKNVSGSEGNEQEDAPEGSDTGDVLPNDSGDEENTEEKGDEEQLTQD